MKSRGREGPDNEASEGEKSRSINIPQSLWHVWLFGTQKHFEQSFGDAVHAPLSHVYEEDVAKWNEPCYACLPLYCLRDARRSGGHCS